MVLCVGVYVLVGCVVCADVYEGKWGIRSVGGDGKKFGGGRGGGVVCSKAGGVVGRRGGGWKSKGRRGGDRDN